MNIRDKFSAPRFADREIDEVGDVRVRYLKTREMLEFSKDKDSETGILKIVAACIYEGENPAFNSPDEVAQLDWVVIKRLNKAAMEVNDFKLDEAEKKTATLPSSEE